MYTCTKQLKYSVANTAWPMRNNPDWLILIERVARDSNVAVI